MIAKGINERWEILDFYAFVIEIPLAYCQINFAGSVNLIQKLNNEDFNKSITVGAWNGGNAKPEGWNPNHYHHERAMADTLLSLLHLPFSPIINMSHSPASASLFMMGAWKTILLVFGSLLLQWPLCNSSLIKKKNTVTFKGKIYVGFSVFAYSFYFLVANVSSLWNGLIMLVNKIDLWFLGFLCFDSRFKKGFFLFRVVFVGFHFYGLML